MNAKKKRGHFVRGRKEITFPLAYLIPLVTVTDCDLFLTFGKDVHS